MDIEPQDQGPFGCLSVFFGMVVIIALVVIVGCTADPTAAPTAVSGGATHTPRAIVPTATFVLRASATPLPAASNTFAPPPTVLPATRAATRIPTNTPIPVVTITTAGTRFAVPTIAATRAADGLTRFVLPLGSGAGRGAWNVFFNAPNGSRNIATYIGGIDVAGASAIAAARTSLDIAAFEWNNPLMTAAVLDAVRRGVTVRMVVDSEHTFEDAESTIQQLADAGIQIQRDNRSAFMHNKFMILDGVTVLTGSWNFTQNDTYRNNNNALFLRAPEAVAAYQSEFNEMFVLRSFGPAASLPSLNNVFTVGTTNVEIYFSPDDPVLDRILNAIAGARSSIRFMAFSFTEDSLGEALTAKAARTSGVSIQGIFETTGSETRFSEMSRLFCAGIDVRQDGGSFVLHHKVFIIDSRIVLTGSFNFSANAVTSNDENLIVLEDPAIAALYIEEFDRRLAESRRPTVTC